MSPTLAEDVGKLPSYWKLLLGLLVLCPAEEQWQSLESQAPPPPGQGLGPECLSYLSSKGIPSANDLAMRPELRRCEANVLLQTSYTPNTKPSIEGATDTSELSCHRGNPEMFREGVGGLCCGVKPHFNWVVATCEPNKELQTSNFCRNVPDCAIKGSPKINYVAAYQFNGKEFVMMKDSTAGDLTDEGVEGNYKEGTGWERHKRNFTWVPGDWTSKYAPWGKGPDGPRGGTPPAMMWVLSAENFYYGAFYMLTQLNLNVQGARVPGTNCWTWELDALEGTIGWGPPGAPLPGNLNQLYTTNNAAVSGCMPVTYSALAANAGKRLFKVPQEFQSECRQNPDSPGCSPWKPDGDVFWSGGVPGSQRFENLWDEPYVFAVVLDYRGSWTYRWRPETDGSTGWPGVFRTKAAAVLPARPRPVQDPRGLQTDVRGDVPEAVIHQPSLPPESACLRSSIEWVNWQFGADALGAMAHQLNQFAPGGLYAGAQNWWAHFYDTKQGSDASGNSIYPMSIAGVPLETLDKNGGCSTDSQFTCKCGRMSMQRARSAKQKGPVP